MTIDYVRKELSNHLGKKATIKYHLGRNKYEKYEVTIKELYNHVFVVELESKYTMIKSFSYSDVLTKTVKIDY